MVKTFAVGDIHGRYDLFTEAIRRIEEASPSGGTVVFLGDYIDRGSQSQEVVEALMAGPKEPDRWAWVCLKGNHESMMVSAVRGPYVDGWLGNGGLQTLASFGGEMPEQVVEWADKLPMYHSDGKRLFVHAGVDPQKPLNEQSEMMLLWFRYSPPNADVGYPGLHVVHGHTPLNSKPLLCSSRTNIDTGAVFGGALTIAVFDDDIAGGPRSLISLAS